MQQYIIHKVTTKDGVKRFEPAPLNFGRHPASYRSWTSWKLDELNHRLKKDVLGRRLGTQSDSGITTSVTTADSWTNIYTSTVPGAMKRLRKVRFGLAPDPGTSATSIRQAPAFRLLGSGLAEQSPHVFMGQFSGYGVVTSGAIGQDNLDIEYDVEIPVQVGGTISVEVNIQREAQTAGSAEGNLFYDEKPPALPNSMSDQSEVAGTTTADAWATATNVTVPTGVGGSAPKRLKGLVFGVAPDQGTSAVSLRTAPRFRVSGSGIGEGGLHEFIGVFGGASVVTSGGFSAGPMTKVVIVDIPVNPAGVITWEHRFDTETPTASSVAIGFLYA